MCNICDIRIPLKEKKRLMFKKKIEKKMTETSEIW